MPNFRRRFTESAAVVIAAILFVLPAHADVVTKADLQIQGSSLAVVDTVVTTQLGATAFVHTSFGGLQDDQAPVIEGLSAVGDLTGPGITTPIQIVTAPGHAFQISGLSQEGIYYLQNVRLMNGTQLLQLAVPSVAAIQVANTLKTTVTVRQLTPDEMRSRGINVDPSNYDVYEYTFSFLVNGQTVTVPYPVIINRTTHEPEPAAQEDPYYLPQDTQQAPPRWVPPSNGGIIILPDVPEFGDGADPPGDPLHPKPRPQIHCAIVIPNSLAVLHQFFAVGLVVANGAPAGSNVKLDSVTASIDVPNQLRIAKVNPPTTFGQPVTIKDPNNPNVTFLIAQATGQADWTLEGLKPGIYTVNLDVKATFQSPGQPDLPLETKPQATVVIHDARFNITFSHPDTIRKNLQYSTYTYITNISDAAQTIT
ncbi:MAG: large repetitive protein, partial [Thermoanaerobaculia bacterium]|nr:large repetitive protein [Thermoanaerobaculia bacterium]